MSVSIAQRGSGTTKKSLQNRVVNVEELVVFCPKCKTFETLCFTKHGLIETQKFSQEDSQVYHDCGSKQPCRLYRTFRRDSPVSSLTPSPTNVANRKRGRLAQLTIQALASVEKNDRQGEEGVEYHFYADEAVHDRRRNDRNRGLDRGKK